MTLQTLKRGMTRLSIVLAVGYDLFVLFAVVQEYAHESAKDLWVVIGGVAILNVAWFVILRACFWILDGFSRAQN